MIFSKQRGFTLVEMAFVLLIIGLLAKMTVGPLSALQEHGKRAEAQRELQDIRNTVFAHLVAYGALPCPLEKRGSVALGSRTETVTRQDLQAVCTVAHGWIPAHHLRMDGSVNANGALLDPWGREYRYSVSLENNPDRGDTQSPDWTTAGEAAAVGIDKLMSNLTLCNTSSRSGCQGSRIRSNEIAFVAMSLGSDASTLGHQKMNQLDDSFFMVTDESVVPGSEFDDLVIWGSAAEVIFHMLQMGWLP